MFRKFTSSSRNRSTRQIAQAARSRNAFRPSMEQLETRWVPSTITVTSAADSGAGTLRDAILTADSSSGTTTIDFAVGTGAQTINLQSALPVITNPVIIDGTSQPGFAGTPLIELNGAGAGAGANGLVVSGGNSTVRGLVINRFAGDGIDLEGTGSDLVAGNYIGTDVTGTNALGNGVWGIRVVGVSNDTIGGTTAADRNLVSGNLATGIRIEGGADGNVVEGNLIGTDVTGAKALGNGLRGVMILGASGNTIGGTAAGAGNVISGNAETGVRLEGAVNNTVVGNLIGTDSTGANALGNGLCGVHIAGGSGNTIGGLTAGSRNVISGNTASGIRIDDGATGNVVEGNYIGTDITGTHPLGNHYRGVIVSGASGNSIGAPGGGNVIAANGWSGVLVENAVSTTVESNFIGTDQTGAFALGNGATGVRVSGSMATVIGGTTATVRNVISGNGASGIRIDLGSTGTLVEGNYIGTDVSGSHALGNNLRGVVIAEAGQNTIGGSMPGAGNVISGNVLSGVRIENASGNFVKGNFIGTDATGTVALGNGHQGILLVGAIGNDIGDAAAGAGNVISGNANSGIRIDVESAFNEIQGNYIGTDVTGTHALGNLGRGIIISNAGLNKIGGVIPGAGNVISGNAMAGIRIEGSQATGNLIKGNWIGTGAQGAGALGNGSSGVVIGQGASENRIGGTGPGAGNTIADNGADGVTVNGNSAQNAILSNSIYGNAALGIDLNPHMVPLVSHGPNDLIPAPMLSAAISGPGTTTITGALVSTPNTTFRIELFANPVADAVGHSQGKTFLGYADVTTNALGAASFTANLATNAAGTVSATATDPMGNTSEFSSEIDVSLIA